MRKHAAIILTGSVALGLSACGDNLTVTNYNAPDVERAYSTPSGIEGVISGLGVQIFNAQRATESVNTQARIFSGENTASVANFGMAARSQIPRNLISNELGNDNQVGNVANFNTFSRATRTAANGIAALDRLVAGGGTLGSTAQNARAKAFGFLMLGQALGNLALAYDSAAIVTPATPSDEVPELSGAKEVMAAALQMLDSSLAQANLTVTGSNGFPLPATWINGQPLTKDQFIRLVRSFKARFRAGVARNPTERAAVNWTEVIADATNGLTADFTVNVGGGSGWTATYDVSQMYVTGGWHAAPYWYFGMADISGGYDNWLAQPLSQRRAFLIVTPDKRWPQGDTRAAQQAAGPTNALPPGVYFRNRPTGEDVPLVGPGDSWYDHRRYGATNLNANTGPYTDMSKTEIDMLAAEGYIRTNNIPAAVALINLTRVKNGLSAIPTTVTATQPISNAADCVPRVPQPPNFTSTACGTVLEAMKYEKRMETAYTGYMVWYADNRGWGDLLTGTAVEWPVPYQEMQVRQKPYYNGTNQAPKGTYGF